MGPSPVRRRKLPLPAVGAAALLLAVRPASAQTLVGRVLDDLTGTPVATARVLLVDSLATAVAWAESDGDGRVVLRAPGAGVFRIYADRLGYGDLLSDTFALAAGGTAELELRLAPLPVELDPLVVTALRRQTKLERQGFYRREAASLGTFFDITDVERWRPTLVTTLLRQVPGVHVMQGRFGAVVYSRRVRTSWGAWCPMRIVLDGFPLAPGEEGLDGWVSPDAVLGIEVYPGHGGVGAPVQHRGTDAYCGIVMVWTR